MIVTLKVQVGSDILTKSIQIDNEEIIQVIDLKMLFRHRFTGLIEEIIEQLVGKIESPKK